MACIYKRGKTWSYSVDIGRDASGKRVKKGKGGFRTQREAKEAAEVLEVEIAGGTFVNEQKITFDELANQWLLEHSKDVKPTTQNLYKYAVDKLLKYSQKTFARDITKTAYQKILNELFEQNLALNTLQSIHMCANLIFKYACQYDILKNNPAKYAKIPRVKASVTEQSEVPKYLEKDELQLFLKTVQETEPYSYYVIFLTLAYTGMRRSELAALQWPDIDFANKTININKNLYLHRGCCGNYDLQTPKTKTSKRIIPVTDNILHELSRLRASQRQQQMKRRQDWLDKSFVFTAQKLPGYPINPNVIWVTMRRVLVRAGLNTTLSPHSLRHTHTSLLAEAGVSLEAIMERLGHANDTITRTIYLHITQETKKDAARKFYELLNGVSG